MKLYWENKVHFSVVIGGAWELRHRGSAKTLESTVILGSISLFGPVCAVQQQIMEISSTVLSLQNYLGAEQQVLVIKCHMRIIK